MSVSLVSEPQATAVEEPAGLTTQFGYGTGRTGLHNCASSLLRASCYSACSGSAASQPLETAPAVASAAFFFGSRHSSMD